MIVKESKFDSRRSVDDNGVGGSLSFEGAEGVYGEKWETVRKIGEKLKEGGVYDIESDEFKSRKSESVLEEVKKDIAKLENLPGNEWGNKLKTRLLGVREYCESR